MHYLMAMNIGKLFKSSGYIFLLSKIFEFDIHYSLKWIYVLLILNRTITIIMHVCAFSSFIFLVGVGGGGKD